MTQLDGQLQAGHGAVGPPHDLGYGCNEMELHTGRIIQGAIVLDQCDALEEGAAVVVCIGSVDQPVRVSDEELDVVRHGKAEAVRGELIDARAFLRELQRQP
jgi:hypothetical protein